MKELYKSILVENRNNRIILVFLLSFFIYGMIMYLLCGKTDLQQHTYIGIVKLNRGVGHLLSGNFLLYFLINLLSFFTGIRNLVKIALCFMLAFATTWKYRLINDDLKTNEINRSSLWALSTLFVFVVPFFAFQSGNWYISYYVPNVWHNSTTIFLFPFALILFRLSIEQYKEYNAHRNRWILLLVVLNIWIKPSYFFVFLCSYPLLLLHRYGLKDKRLWQSVFPVFVGLLVLIEVYITIYVVDMQDNVCKGNSSTMISFSNVLSISWVLHQIKYLVISFIFPLLYIATHFRKVVADKTFIYIISQNIIAIAIFWLCYETGPRAKDGNFYWQIVICSWILFYYTLRCLLKLDTQIDKFKKPLLIYYAISVMVGVAYLFRIIVVQVYI